MLKKYIFALILCLSFSAISCFAANSTEEKTNARGENHGMEHPPHNHEHHDHLKKLDEGMQRRRKKIY